MPEKPHVIIKNMGHGNRITLFGVILFMLFIISCSAQAEGSLATETVENRLTPFLTYTPTPTLIVETAEIFTPTLPPSPTPTPRIHVVKKGEDLGGIAFAYQVSLQALMEANPDIDPYILSIGTELIIPASEAADLDTTPVPTPIALTVSGATCYEEQSVGYWCLASIDNQQAYAVESVSVQFKVIDPEGEVIDSRAVSAPLRRILPEQAVPVVIYIPGQFSQENRVIAEIATALPVKEDDPRYASQVQILEQHVEYRDLKLDARITGMVKFEHQEGYALNVAILAIAFDKGDNIVGLRQWRSDGYLEAGEEIPFSLIAYSMKDEIERVDLIAEAYQ